MFKSDQFNVNMLMMYLHQKDSEGIQAYLINTMYNEDLYDIDFYMPQLCYMAITKTESYSVKRFILEMAMKHQNFALKSLMYV